VYSYRQNNIFISVGSHFVLNGSFQLELSAALTFGALHRVNWNGSQGSVFMQHAPAVASPDLFVHMRVMALF